MKTSQQNMYEYSSCLSIRQQPNEANGTAKKLEKLDENLKYLLAIFFIQISWNISDSESLFMQA